MAYREFFTFPEIADRADLVGRAGLPARQRAFGQRAHESDLLGHAE